MAWTWVNVLLIGTCVSLSLPSSTAAEDGDNFEVIIGVGAGGLALLIILWVLLCFCLKCLCFADSNKKPGNRAAQRQQTGGFDGPAADPWAVAREELGYRPQQPQPPPQHYSQYSSQQQSNYSKQQQQQSLYAATPLPPPPYPNYAKSAPYTNTTGIPIPKPDYYYDPEVTKPTEPTSAPMSPTSPGPPGTSFKLKPVPPPKPKKTIPAPDYE